eukprot:12281694-Karenia_brevis.AAC.1
MLERVAALHLKPPKCKIIPCTRRRTIDLVSRTRDWLHAHVPSWASFSIVDAALYLGFWMGPKAGVHMWTAA